MASGAELVDRFESDSYVSESLQAWAGSVAAVSGYAQCFEGCENDILVQPRCNWAYLCIGFWMQNYEVCVKTSSKGQWNCICI